MTLALARWLFPTPDTVHPAWYALWLAPNLVTKKHLSSNGPVTRQLKIHIRHYCGTPEIPTGDIPIGICSLRDANRMALGEELAQVVCAPAIRRIIDMPRVTAIQHFLGRDQYHKILKSKPADVIPLNQISNIEKSIKHACDNDQLPQWLTALSIHLLERVIGSKQQFIAKRLSLHGPPTIRQHRGLSVLVEQEALIDYCQSSCSPLLFATGD